MLTLTLTAILGGCAYAPPDLPSPGGMLTQTYRPDPSLFPNPERGYHVAIDPDYPTNKTAAPLTLAQLQGYRAQGITLVRKYYLLYDYKGSDIAQSYLDTQLISDLNTARQAGVKLIPRFTYVWNLGFAAGADEDVPAARILRHLEQLRPIFSQNDDVIDHVQIGFVGRWGEWHDSTNNNVNNADLTLNDNSKQIIAKMLDVVPKSRMVELRYPKHLSQLYPTPLTATEAYSGSDQARLGLHDDGFLYDETHFGNYDPDPAVRTQQRNYQEEATKYVSMSGEPGGVNGTGYALQSDPLRELARMHWSSLSNGQGDSDALYAQWKSAGVYDTIAMRLGYRFNLVSAAAPSSVAPGEPFKLSFTVQNAGFAPPRNERPVEVVLRNAATKAEYFARVNTDPRRWMPGATQTVDMQAALPANLPQGEYQVLLNLPDPAPRLYGRPEYSIRLANTGMWENYSGYNDLKLRVRLAAGGTGGPQAFVKRAVVPSPEGAPPAITLTPQLPQPGAAATPELKQGDVLVDFNDRSPGPLNGSYGGVDWGSGAWATASDGNGRYLRLAGGNSATFTLPEGKVLKSLAVRKLSLDSTSDEFKLSAPGNPDYIWDNPAPWWSQHTLGWRTAARGVTLTLASNSASGAGNLIVDNLVYGDPPAADVTVDFAGKKVGDVLRGLDGGIDWGTSGLWRIGADSDGTLFAYVDSQDLEKTVTITLPAGKVLKGIAMRKREGEDVNGDAVKFTDAGGNVQQWAWLPSGGWNTGYGFDWTVPSGRVTLTVSSKGATKYGVSNVLFKDLRYGEP